VLEDQINKVDLFNEKRAQDNLGLCRQLVQLVREVTLTNGGGNNTLYCDKSESTLNSHQTSITQDQYESSALMVNNQHMLGDLFDKNKDSSRNIEELEQLLPVVCRCLQVCVIDK